MSLHICPTKIKLILSEDRINFAGPVEFRSTSTWIPNRKAHFCPTINGVLIECLTELKRHNCSFTRSDMLSGLNAMLKDVLPVRLVMNLRLEGKTLSYLL